MKIKNIYKLHCLIASILYGADFLRPPKFHKEILEIYNNNERKQLVVAPVGFAKSLTAKTFLIKEILEGRKFQLLICSNRDQVALQMGSIFKILKSKIFQELFEYKILAQNETEITLEFKTGKRAIFGRGAEAEILGINFEGNRPYNIVIDDLESQEQVASFYRTKKLLDWMDISLISRLPSLTEGKIRWIGTNLGQNSLVNQILTKKIRNWDFYKFTALDSDNQSIWEEQHKTEGLLKEQIENPHSFAANYMNEPMNNSDTLFKDSDIGYYDYVNWDDFDELYEHDDTTHTAKTTSDYFCYVLAGKNKKDSKIYVLDFILSKDHPPQLQRRHIIDSFRKYPKLKRLTYDKISNDAFEQDTIDEARKEGVYLHPPRFEGVKFGADKYTHMLRHEHLIKSKSVVLPMRHPQIHEAVFQLVNFSVENIKSNSKLNDDFVDGLSGVLDNFVQPVKTYGNYLELQGIKINK